MSEKGCVMLVGELSAYGQITTTAAELVTLALRLARDLGCPSAAAIVGGAVDEAASQLASMGLDRVCAVETAAAARYVPEVFSEAVKAVLATLPTSVVLLSNSPMGQDLAPRLACELEAGLVTDCVEFEVVEGSRVVCTRPIYGGNVMASCVSNRQTLVATVRQHSFEAAVGGSGSAEIAKLSQDVPQASGYVVGECVTERSGDIALEDAHVVVSGGRGIGGQEGFEQLAGLARFLGGAVGASRPPVDSGWINTTAQVGITGKIVAPDTYIAVGLSGSSQHLTGMSDSRKVVAVNSDPEAYIFKVSDYGVAGDWRKVIPAFESKLRELLGKDGA